MPRKKHTTTMPAVPESAKSTAKGVQVAPSLVQFDQLPDSANVRLPTVSALCGGVGPATVWRWVKAGRLPAATKLGPNTTVWNVGALRRKLASALGEA